MGWVVLLGVKLCIMIRRGGMNYEFSLVGMMHSILINQTV
jgi:hypothetical protein